MTQRQEVLEMEECVFCQIVAGKSLCYKIWESDSFLAILSLFPNTDGFTVLMTKKHYPSDLSQLSEDIFMKMMWATRRVSLLLTEAFEDVGRTGIIVEGFGINHAHVKLFPMHGTKKNSPWEPIHSTIKTFFPTYPGYLSSNASLRADDTLLEKQAQMIRAVQKQMNQ